MTLQEKINKRIEELELSVESIKKRYRSKDTSELETRVEYLEDIVESVLDCIIELKQLNN